MLSKEEIGKILKSAREHAGFTQVQVAQRLGKRQQVIGNWETGYAQPDANSIFLLCDLYGISVDDAFRGGKKERLTAPERALIKKYRDLDEYGKLVIDAVLDLEYTRCSNTSAPTRVISMPVYSDPAAAGIPLYAESEFERMDFPEDEVPRNAEFGVRISGNSMEPTIHDGQVVWIRRASEITDHHIGVFMLDGGNAVCKRATVCADGRVTQLLSDNPAYDPIVGEQLNGLRLVGEVIL